MKNDCGEFNSSDISQENTFGTTRCTEKAGEEHDKRDRECIPYNKQKKTCAPCSFSNGISKYEFNQIVKRQIKKSDRLDEIKVFDAKVYGRIRSQSGKSYWRFVLDFNDGGIITGFYRCRKMNNDSEIPIYIGNSIKDAILQKK